MPAFFLARAGAVRRLPNKLKRCIDEEMQQFSWCRIH
jgi:hypothetical protein